jgi:SNF2 family DNA or RNA helicase
MTLTYLGGLMRAGTIRSALVLAPLSVLRAWENEAHKVLTLCMPTVQIQVLSSSMSAHKRRWALEEALESSPDYPTLVISTYGQVQSNSEDFSPKNRLPWDYVVLDEGHLIKNPAANTSKCCRKICSHRDTRRLMLTGTPVQNNLKVCNFLSVPDCKYRSTQSNHHFLCLSGTVGTL